MTDPTTVVAHFEWIKPTAIAPHPKNIRRSLGDLTELAASIKAQGVLQSLVVAPAKTKGKYVLITGHRRHAASKKAVLKEVPCMVREDLTSEADQLQAMLAENLQRADLDVIEEGDAYQAVLELDVTVKDLSAATGTTQKRIKERVKLAAAPAGLRDQLIAHQVTIEEATVLQSFADDDEIYAELQKYVGNSNWDWAVKRAKDTRARATKIAKIVKDLVAAGVRVLDAAERAEYRKINSDAAGQTLNWEKLPGQPADPTALTVAAMVNDPGYGTPESVIAWLRLVPETAPPSIDSPAGGTPRGDIGIDDSKPDPDTPAVDPTLEAQNKLRADLETAASVRRAYLRVVLNEGDLDVGAACARALIWEWSGEMMVNEIAIDTTVVADVLDLELPEVDAGWQEREKLCRIEIRKLAESMSLQQLAILATILHASNCEALLTNPRDWDPEYFDDWQRPYLELLDGPLAYTWSDVEKDLLDTLKAVWEGDEDSDEDSTDADTDG